MRYPQIVIYETDGQFAEFVGDLARDNSWVVREARQPAACLKLLRDSRPAVLLLKLERKLVDELSLLAQVHEKAPDCPVLVVSDVKLDRGGQRSTLAGLAYDLGARYVMFPPLTRTAIEDLVAGCLEAVIRRHA
jgi:chemotaxis response regulator CheB